MSELSFQTFCIEFYSKHIQKPSPEVYALFARNGLLDMLKTDYDDLHGMGMEALMQFFDEYLAKELSSPETMNAETIEHCQVRSINVSEIIKILCRYYDISEDEALKRFYESATGANYADDETGLYGQSALHIAGLFIVEQDGDINHSRL